MNITEAIRDRHLLGHFLGEDLTTWQPWLTALRALYGLPITSRSGAALVQRCTGRSADKLPAAGFSTALFLTGRRSGKSRIAGVIGAYEAVLAGHEAKLAKGENGVVAVCAPTKHQGRIVKDYLRAIFNTPVLQGVVAKETPEGFDLTNRCRIEILAGDWRTIRGFTLLAAIVDEACFFAYEAESKVKSDTELVRAIRPALATVGGKLICISSLYAQKGWCYEQHKRNYGNDTGRVLVWQAPSRVMNTATLPQSVVDDAMAEDMAAARSEYMAEWRDDIAQFLPRNVVEGLVVGGRIELMPERGCRYVAFADMSGGRADDAALAIAHRKGRVVVLDKLCRYRPPFNPHTVIGQMAEEIKRYGIRHVTGDNYAGEYTAAGFTAHGIRYSKAEQPKAQIYAELIPRACSGEIELLDEPVLVDQLASLERRTRSGGRDVIDHPPGGHDDVANAVAGVAVCAATPAVHVGGFR